MNKCVPQNSTSIYATANISPTQLNRTTACSGGANLFTSPLTQSRLSIRSRILCYEAELSTLHSGRSATGQLLLVPTKVYTRSRNHQHQSVMVVCSDWIKLSLLLLLLLWSRARWWLLNWEIIRRCRSTTAVPEREAQLRWTWRNPDRGVRKAAALSGLSRQREEMVSFAFC